MKKLLLSILMLLFYSNISAQNGLWRQVSDKELISKSKMDRSSVPIAYKLYSINLDELKSRLIGAPNDLSGQVSNVIISFPNDKGELSNFRVYDSPIMEDGLAEKFPDIKTYLGKGIIEFSLVLDPLVMA